MSSVDAENNSDSKRDGFWDEPRSTRVYANRPPNILRKKAEPAKGDWDDEEEEEEVDDETLWREANAMAPMPEVIIARPSTSSATGTVVPPPEAFQAPVRILKRPKPASSTSQSTGSASLLQKTLEDREAAYQAARERIFGLPSKPESLPGSPSEEEKLEALNSSISKLEVAPPPPPPSRNQRQQNKEKSRAGSRSMSSESVGRAKSSDQGGVSVIRNPRGPSVSSTPGSSTPSRGFSGRRGGKRSSASKEKTQSQPPSAPVPSTSDPTLSSSNI